MATLICVYVHVCVCASMCIWVSMHVCITKGYYNSLYIRLYSRNIMKINFGPLCHKKNQPHFFFIVVINFFWIFYYQTYIITNASSQAQLDYRCSNGFIFFINVALAETYFFTNHSWYNACIIDLRTFVFFVSYVYFMVTGYLQKCILHYT